MENITLPDEVFDTFHRVLFPSDDPAKFLSFQMIWRGSIYASTHSTTDKCSTSWSPAITQNFMRKGGLGWKQQRDLKEIGVTLGLAKTKAEVEKRLKEILEVLGADADC
jgi:hypothetical protein